jgi:endo-1,4-beta-mannosidase
MVACNSTRMMMHGIFQEWSGQPGSSSGKFVYRKENLKHLDVVLDEARKIGIRIICGLCNNWEQFGYAVTYVKKYRQHHNNIYTAASVTT